MLLAAVPAWAQQASVTGRVTDASDGAPLPGATVLVEDLDEGEQRGTATDAQGLFVLPGLLPGAYALRVTFVGYAPFADTLALDFGERAVAGIALEPQEQEATGVTVEADRAAADERAGAGLRVVGPREIAQVPTPGLAPDLAGYLQTLPGVVAVGDRGGQLFVRGGTPTENLVLLDGIPIYQPFHLLGFYSAFPASIVSHADVYAGGFPARYGGRIASVIAVNSTNGNKRRVEGAVSAAPFLAGVHAELPVVPEKASLVLSLRESVIDRLAPEALREAVPYRFGDRFAKLHAFLNATSSFSITVLQTYDEGDLTATGEGDAPPSPLRWDSRAAGGTYRYLPSSHAVMAEVSGYTTQFESSYAPADGARRESLVRGFGGAFEFTYFLGPAQLRFGFFGRTNVFRYDIEDSREGEFEEFVTEGGFYMQGRREAGRRWQVEPGLRLHSFPSRSSAYLEPRLRTTVRLGAGRRHALSLALGRYHQEIVGLYQQSDLTDAFVIWRPSPENEPVPSATHAVLGWEGELRRWLEVGVESYAKAMQHVLVADYRAGRRGGLLLEPTDARAVGLDVRVRVARRRLFAQVSYGLAHVRYDDETGTGTYPPPHDRRHQATLMARYDLGVVTLGARWQGGSGLPYSATAGFYRDVDVPRPDPDVLHEPGADVLLLGERYADRLAAYHRLDLTAQVEATFGRVRLAAQASLTNAYDRSNLFSFDLFTERRIDGLPRIPSLALRVELF